MRVHSKSDSKHYQPEIVLNLFSRPYVSPRINTSSLAQRQEGTGEQPLSQKHLPTHH